MRRDRQASRQARHCGSRARPAVSVHGLVSSHVSSIAVGGRGSVDQAQDSQEVLSSRTCKQTASTGGVHSAKRDWMMPNAAGLLAIRSERSIRAPPAPASADWSMPPADIADTSKHTCFRVRKKGAACQKFENKARIQSSFERFRGKPLFCGWRDGFISMTALLVTIPSTCATSTPPRPTRPQYHRKAWANARTPRSH